MNRTRRHTAVVAVAVAVVGFALLVWLRGHIPTHAGATSIAVDQPVATCDNPGPDPVPHISSTIAVECPDVFDTRTVVFVGEVAGDVLRRGRGAWLQVNDDGYGLGAGPLAATGQPADTNAGIAVWVPDLEGLDLLPGRADRRGTVVQFTGEFLRADPADGGGTSIRASDTRPLAPGERLPPPTDWVSLVIGLVGVAGAGVAWARVRGS